MPTAALPARICVLRLSALGDVVLAVPAVRALALTFPHSQIDWITDRALAPLLAGLPANVRVVGVAKPSNVADYLALRRQLGAARYDLLLAMQASFRANLVYPLLRAPVKIGFDAPRSRELHGLFINQRIAPGDRHLADGFMAFAHAAGVPADAPMQWDLQLDPQARAWAAKATGGAPSLLINPSASKPHRNWPIERNAAVARHAMTQHGLRVVLCGGPGAADRERAAAIAHAAPGVLDLAGQTDLPKLFALIAGAHALVSPDSGPVHIARAFDVPVVGLYADAHLHKSGPYGRTQWSIDVWEQAVRQLLHKDPSRMPWDTRIYDVRAMALITVEAVTGALDRALADTSG